MTRILDPIALARFQRTNSIILTPAERDDVMMGEGRTVIKRNNRLYYVTIPLIYFPEDLIDTGTADEN